jgi:hypothetical protein
VLNYVQVFPLALLSLVCGVANYSVNGKLWKIDSIEHELNPIHRWFMGRFGVDRGMALSIIIAGSIFISGIAIPLLMFHPQYFLQGFVILSVPPLAIVSPVAVVMLVNDYYWLHRLGRDVVTFKVMGLEGKGKVNTVTH